ncbi:sigma-54 interaction domain-containing protein [Desulfurivibrio sp. C05AmB]|jgi:formate hydrogenlyase transcriptional activator|uniref:sigma-54 interaction domain-containing protein n=1 Tax=Desulfurivibrio sp. C05AmB TaxID=3374371 RepID=UPI00376F27D0
MGIDKGKPRQTAAGKLHRQKAEQPQAPVGGGIHQARTEPEAQRLLHELTVHQIELEMQNAELRNTREELELSRNRYAELYDFAPVGYFTIDAGGLIREVNLAGAQLLGIERQRLVKMPFSDLLSNAASREIFSRHRDAVSHNQGMQKCEIDLKRKDGTTLPVELQSIMVKNIGDKVDYIHTTVLDVSDRRRAEDALQKAYGTLEQMVEKRTQALVSANEQLLLEVEERKAAEASLRKANAEIKLLSDRLQVENIQIQKELSRGYDFGDILGKSDAISYVFFRVEQVAPQEATVLLLGETGTGKGLIARAIHSRSVRKNRPMITVNCAALPENLIESELFGREKGAFTGANALQMGRFELANGGTIFLDEIGEMPLPLQCKLLRVIQDGEFERLGSPHTIKVNVRIIAASNRKLEEEIRAGRFREDLFYRLNVFPITIPPLRQRKDDIPILVQYFVAKYNKKIGKEIDAVSQKTMNALQEYQWPGNVRELENVIERAVITSHGSELQVLDRFDTFREPGGENEVHALADLERDHILKVLQKTGWRIEGKKGAAIILGLNPSTLRARMRKYGLHHP